MTGSDHSYETSGDRSSLAREAGVGKLSFISVLAGVLVAYGGTVASGVQSNRRPPPESLNAIGDARIDCFSTSDSRLDGKRLHFATRRRHLRARCNSAERLPQVVRDEDLTLCGSGLRPLLSPTA
jgi:hypothetical protein